MQAMIGLGTAEAKALPPAVGDDLPTSAHAEGVALVTSTMPTAPSSWCSRISRRVRLPSFTGAEDDDVLSVAESLMDELATLHATYWGQELPWLGRHCPQRPRVPRCGSRAMAQMGASIVQMAVDQFAGDLPPEFSQLAALYIARPLDLRGLINEGEPTLIHGDNHIGNLFVEDGRTGFYDWAVASRFPGMRDVGYFLCNSLPTEVRRSEEDRLIARYRAGLAAAGVTLDADVAQQQYRLCSIISWISATTTAAMGSRWQPADVGWRATVRTTDAIVDLDVLGLLAERGVSAT